MFRDVRRKGELLSPVDTVNSIKYWRCKIPMREYCSTNFRTVEKMSFNTTGDMADLVYYLRLRIFELKY